MNRNNFGGQCWQYLYTKLTGETFEKQWEQSVTLTQMGK